MDTTLVTQINQRCDNLKSSWRERNNMMKVWYEDLTLKNVLKQDGMESVISNDPRTSYNLGLHLLTSSLITHKIRSDVISRMNPEDISYLQTFMYHRWEALESEQRDVGKQSMLRQLASYPLATGWIAVYVWADNDTLGIEVWNPKEVYPRYGYNGLAECMHEYEMDTADAARKAKLLNWITPNLRMKTKVRIRNYFYYNEAGQPINTVMYDNEVVKIPAIIPANMQHSRRIPVLMSPVSGLPDNGAILGNDEYQKHIGEAMLAVNHDINLNHNKMLTFLQQLVRDTANPRVVEKTRGDSALVNENNFYSRGAMYRIQPDESIETVAMPPIPLEMSTMNYDYQNQKQRGSFPWVLHGNIQQQMTGYMVSQIASASLSTITPYSEMLAGIIADIDNFWLKEIVSRGLKPYGYEKKETAKEAIFKVGINVNIPGSMIQRITMAKMANPSFKLDNDTIFDTMFPEVKDPIEARAKIQRSEAEEHPLAKLAIMYSTYKNMVKEAIRLGDTETAEIYSILVQKVKAEITGTMMGGQSQSQPQQSVYKPPREVSPSENNSYPVERS